MALDHWIACAVLRLLEELWEHLLRSHGDRAGRDDVDAVRAALFPEMAGAEEEEEAAADDRGRGEAIDDLLARLSSGEGDAGLFADDPTFRALFEEETSSEEEEERAELEAQRERDEQVYGELEGWREKH